MKTGNDLKTGSVELYQKIKETGSDINQKYKVGEKVSSMWSSVTSRFSKKKAEPAAEEVVAEAKEESTVVVVEEDNVVEVVEEVPVAVINENEKKE